MSSFQSDMNKPNKPDKIQSNVLRHTKSPEKETSNGQPFSANAPASNNFNRNKAASQPLNLNLGVSYREVVDCQSWPNLVQGRKMCEIKGGASTSFSQKVQCQSSCDSTSRVLKAAEMVPPKPVTETLQELGAFHPKNNKPESLQLERSLITDKSRKKIKKQKRILPKDTHICVIDRSKKEEWFQLEPKKQPFKSPALLGEDFPDLASAFKVVSKYTVQHEFDMTAQAGENFSDTSPQLCHVVDPNGQKFRKKQPRRKDPISVDIIDILKKTDSCIRISSKNLRKIKNKDHERKTLGRNFLDSSNPVRKRGKHREAGPVKKLSKMKNIILSERIQKQEQKGDLVKELSLVPEEIVKPSVASVCDGIVSLNIVEDTGTSCSQLIKDGGDCSITGVEIRDLVNFANLNDDCLPILPNTASTILQLNNIPSTLHSRKFRDYCDNIRSKALDEAVTNLLKTIYGFQDRHYQKDPIRAHAKRRFVLGIREVKKFLMLKKLKFIVIAPDLEPVKSPGGLDETIIQIREEGRAQKIPVIFAVGRRQLGYTLMKKVPISIVGIISQEGAEELYREVLNQWHIATDSYQQKVSELCCMPEIK